MTLAVTGATGRLGGRVARRLAAAAYPLRLLVRDPGRAPRLPGAEAAVADYGDPAALREALAGAGTVFMVSAAESPDRVDRHRAFIDAAAAAGVRHLVYTSFVGASPDATFTLARDHAATEEHLRASGLTFTILRDNLYADFLPLMVGEDGVIRGPGGDGRAAVVAQDDIADASVAVLRDPATHGGATYDLTGPEALSFAEMAATMSAESGNPVRYESETLAQAYASRARYGAPEWQVQAWVSTYTAVAAGELAAVSPAVPRLTGRPATPFAEVLRGARPQR
ncbi:SDR family oxidoreductase [Krasilnikovia sp. MM14-A1259]|uniref:SDR family oxidoreductase n=1 Tax=Krasilnikovia sp. MM14-A1259 TaxID=3373539 RepID=UPI00382AD727